MSIADNIARIQEKIEDSAQKNGYRGQDVTLMAVTKTRTIDEIKQAIACGITTIGENRAQELLAKYDSLRDYCDMQFIGHLQTNKVASVIDKVSMIQSLDSRRLAQQIENKAGQIDRCISVLVQVNTGAEESKTGFLFEEVSGFLDDAEQYPHLKICGLMAVLPVNNGKKEESEAIFDKMFQLFVDMKAKKADNINMGILSMGMSNDYDLAVAHGANLVRVGSGIFGPRNYR
jgi:pyridoxal phosphate enzyme (YggS family)